MRTVATFRNQILRVIILPALLFCILSGVFFGLVLQLLSVLDQVDQADRLVARANATLRALVDREAALRAYLVTGLTDLLRAYREADGVLGGSFDEMGRLTSNDPEQLTRLRRIQEQSELSARKAGEEIELRAGLVKGDRNSLGTSPDERRKDEIRDSMTAFLDAEQADRDSRGKEIRSRTWTILAGSLGAAIPLGLILIYSSRKYLINLGATFEAALDDLQAKFERQEVENLGLLAEAMKYYAIFKLDQEGRIMSWNAESERILGYREVDILGAARPASTTLMTSRKTRSITTWSGPLSKAGWRTRDRSSAGTGSNSKLASRWWRSVTRTEVFAATPM